MRRDFFQRTQQKRYASGSRENPYFRGKGSRQKLRIMILLLSSSFFFLTAASLLFAHSVFDVTKVHIIGAQNLDRSVLSTTITEYMKERVVFFFHRQNRFLFDETRFREALNAPFTFRDVQLKRMGRTLEVRVVERTSQLIWLSEGLWYVVDLDGIAIGKLEESEFDQFKGIGMPVFADRNNVPVHIGKQILTPDEIEAVFAFHEHLEAQRLAFTQTEFDRLAGKWVGVLTTQGYRILFDPSGDISAQAGRLEVILREKVSDRSKLEYIDLRFGDHVYFR